MLLGKRKHQRETASLIICYSLPAHNPEKLWTAMMEDYSYTGLCIVTTSHLEEGQEILIKSGLLEEPRLGIVRWTKINGDALCKVGLEFKR